MPWSETSAMEERVKFIADICSKNWPFSDLCRLYRISRPTGYKWFGRFLKDGLPGLCKLSHARHHHPNATPVEIENILVAWRKQHRHWGPKKLLHLMSLENEEIVLPAVSTAGAILKRHGLVKPRRRKSSASPHQGTFADSKHPNDVWAADFKGWFRTRDGCRIDPLTITDNFSRKLLCCEGLDRPTFEYTRPHFRRCFKEYGLPDTIRIDNGPPFGSTGLCGLTRLSVWWIRLGIEPERIRPGKPQDNGRHERMHKTLKEATAKPPSANARRQQKAFDVFIREYNEIRPHESLGMKTPSQCYRPSSRLYPRRLPELEYTRNYVLRRVRSTAQVKWKGRLIFTSAASIGETVGLIEIDNDTWRMDFGTLQLGILSPGSQKLERCRCGQPCRGWRSCK